MSVVYTKRHWFKDGNCVYCLINENWFRNRSTDKPRCRGLRETREVSG